MSTVGLWIILLALFWIDSIWSIFFPRLFSAIADWMSTILPHMVWTYCEFRMYVWNLLHASRWKYRKQNIAKNSPTAHHRTTLSGCIFATKAHIDNREKAVKQQYLPQMSLQYGALQPTSSWDRFVSLGTPGNFNGFRVLAALLHGTLVVGVSQTLRRWTEGAIYIRQGGHHVVHWPTF